ncbi:MAG: MoaD/ThiS family protein [Bacteroidota bacterium]
MKIRILIFGQLKDIIQSDELWMEDLHHSDELISLLQQKFPGIQNLQFKMAVNKKMVHQSVKLQEQDVIALLPAFSGG